MLVAPGGTLSVPAATGWVSMRIVSFEEEYGEGPCVDAFNDRTTIDVPDLTAEARWPRFTPRCLEETPVRSCIGLPLVVDDRSLGALDLYADDANAFTDDDRAAAALFAAHVSVAVAAAKERVELQQALASRDLIGQAKGILIAQSHISADEAFDLLRRGSQRMNKKLTAVAQELVARHTGPAGDGR
jgi:GAF domain-containing protein